MLLDKNAPQIRTVVNKTGTIENVFRTFPMEVVAVKCTNTTMTSECIG